MSRIDPNRVPTNEPESDRPPHRTADDREEVYYAGSPLLRGDLSKIFGWGLVGGVLIAIPILIRIFNGAWPAWWIVASLMILGLLLWLIPLVITRTIHYRISNYRIDYERGLLSKKIDTLELWHVDDISFGQSLLGRMLGVGTITVMSDDQTTPNLALHGLPNPRPLFETLKQRIIAVKRQRGVIKMDMG